MKSSAIEHIKDRLSTRVPPLGGPLLFAAIAAFAALAGDTGREALRLERAALEAGEFWRLFTAHIAHLGAGHLLLNLFGLSLMAWILASARLRVWWWCLCGGVSALVIDAGLLLDTDLAWYVGLSGVLHGFWAAGAVRLFRGGERTFSLILATVLAAKLAGEWFAGPSALTIAISGGRVITAAHVLGAVGGLAAEACLAICVWIRRSAMARRL